MALPHWLTLPTAPPPPAAPAIPAPPAPWWATGVPEVSQPVPQPEGIPPAPVAELAGAPGAPQPPADPKPNVLERKDLEEVPLSPKGYADMLAEQHKPSTLATMGQVTGGADQAQPIDPYAPEKKGKAQPQQPQRPASYADMIAEGANAEQQSIGRQGELAAQQADAQARGLERQAQFKRDQIAEQQAAEMDRRKDLRMRSDRLEMERQAIANTKIDPNAYWASKSDFQKGVGMVGAFLGGMLGSANGTNKNEFTDWMDEQAAINLEAQKANLVNRTNMLEEGQNLYAQMLATYQDERTADAMFMAHQYDALGLEIQSQVAKFEGPKAREAAVMGQIQAGQRANAAIQQAAEAEFERDLKRQEMQLAKSANARAWSAEKRAGVNDAWQRDKDVADMALEYEKLGLSRAQAEQQARAQAAGKGIDVEKWEAEKEARTLKNPDGESLLDPRTGKPFLMPNGEVAFKERTSLDSTWAFRSTLEKYLNLAEKAGSEFSGIPGMSKTDTMAELERLYGDMLWMTKDEKQTGALDKGMVEVFSKYVGEPKAWLGKSNPTASARAGLKSWKDQTNGRYRMRYGYQGNFVDDWDKQVKFDTGAPGTSEWKHEQNRKDVERQKKLDEENWTSAPTIPPKPIGTPGSMGMRDERLANREELAREKPEVIGGYGEVRSGGVTLHTKDGTIQVPLGSLNEDNAIPLADGSFQTPDAELPSDMPPTIPWEDVAAAQKARRERLKTYTRGQ